MAGFYKKIGNTKMIHSTTGNLVNWRKDLYLDWRKDTLKHMKVFLELYEKTGNPKYYEFAKFHGEDSKKLKIRIKNLI